MSKFKKLKLLTNDYNFVIYKVDFNRYINYKCIFSKRIKMFSIKKIKLIKFFFVVLLFTIIMSLTLKFTYSKFVQDVKLNTTSGVAKFMFSVNTPNKEIIKDSLNNDQLIYDFSIQNFSKDISSEVKSKYNINLELSQNLPPLIIQLYRIKNGKEELVELQNYSTKNPEIFELGAQTTNYRIKVSYDKNNKTALLQDGFNIKIKAVSVQEEG